MDEPQADEELPPYYIEPARSSRSKCKTCRRKIDKGELRFGVLVEGAYGIGYMWNHLKCAAKRQIDAVQNAYADEAWEEGVEVPALDKLQALAEKAEQARAEKRIPPYVELDPSGRAKCKVSGETIPKNGPRVVMARSVEFYNQVRTTPVNVLPAHVKEELARDDSAIDRSTFVQELRQNSRDLPAGVLEEVLAEIGEL